MELSLNLSFCDIFKSKDSHHLIITYNGSTLNVYVDKHENKNYFRANFLIVNLIRYF